ncbi:MAG: hypothetical protein HOH33_11900 [Verrucomicrobia bacterium]|nr:hypothetical protein [Verrucomicrobiota bacterium]
MGAVEMDLIAYQVRVDGNVVELTNKEYGLLLGLTNYGIHRHSVKRMDVSLDEISNMVDSIINSNVDGNLRKVDLQALQAYCEDSVSEVFVQMHDGRLQCLNVDPPETGLIVRMFLPA